MDNTVVSLKVSEKLDSLALSLVLDGVNPDFGTKYHKLNGLLGELRPKMNAAGIMLSQLFLGVRDGSVVVRTIVTDKESSESTQFDTHWPCPNGLTPYEIGSLVTYTQVYALRALLSRPGSADDNGRAANRGATRESGGTQVPAEQKKAEEQPKRHVLLVGETSGVKPDEAPNAETAKADNGSNLFQKIEAANTKQNGQIVYEKVVPAVKKQLLANR